MIYITQSMVCKNWKANLIESFSEKKHLRRFCLCITIWYHHFILSSETLSDIIILYYQVKHYLISSFNIVKWNAIWYHHFILSSETPYELCTLEKEFLLRKKINFTFSKTLRISALEKGQTHSWHIWSHRFLSIPESIRKSIRKPLVCLCFEGV